MNASPLPRRLGERLLAIFTAIAMVLSLMLVFADSARSQEEEPQTGTLRVKKQAKDDTADGSIDATFNFTFDNQGSTGEFTLQHQESQSWTVAVGESVTVTETDVPDGWRFEDIDCETVGGDGTTEAGSSVIDNENKTVTMTLTEPGGHFKCDFDNEMNPLPPNTGRLIIEKKSTDDPTQQFSFNVSGDLTEEFTLTHDEHITFDVEPGTTITVTETLPDGWYLEHINCDDEDPTKDAGGTSEEDLENNSVTMRLDTAGKELECSFDNELRAADDTTTTSSPTTTSSTTTTTTPTTTTTTAPPPPSRTGDANDEMFFYRNDGLFRFYDVGSDGNLPKPFLSGDNYTTGWDAITAVDLDGDGQDEFFFYRSDGLFRFYHIKQDGTLPKPLLEGDNYTTGWDVITAIDLDGDGQDEMFFYRNDGLFRFYHVNSDGSLPEPLLEGDNYTTGWDSITAIDLDGDGQDEMFFYRSDGVFRFYHINPDGSLPKPMLEGDGYTTGWDTITAIDLEGDGQDEMFFYRQDGLFRYYNVQSDGSLPAPMQQGNNYTTGWDMITAIALE